MPLHQPNNALPHLIVKAQAAEHLVRHAGALSRVSPEMSPPRLIQPHTSRFPDVVQQHGIAHRYVRR